jgi:protoheme IX farnesyltransferase
MINSKLKNKNLSQENVFNFSELFKLMKPRVMSLVIFTCAVGLLMAPTVVSTKDAMIAILLVSIGAGAAGALNMWYESDLDALMTRTCLRPIPMGKVNKIILQIQFQQRCYYLQFYFMCLFTQFG